MAQSSAKKVAKKSVSKKAASKKKAAGKKASAAKKSAAKKKASKTGSSTRPAAKKVAKKKATVKKVVAKKPASKKVSSTSEAIKVKNEPSKKKVAAKKATVKKKAAKQAASKTSATATPPPKKKATESASATITSTASESTTSASTEVPSKKVVSKKTAKAASKKKVAEKKPADEAKSTKTSVPAGPKITVGELDVPDHTKALRDSSGHYMTPDELGHFSQKLTDWKQQLMDEVDRTVGHMKDDATNFPDPNDRATQEEEFSLELRTRDRERKLIKKINEAQKRIDDLEYGYCETCGVEIGVGRLEARPTAELCIDCKTLEEVRERQNA